MDGVAQEFRWQLGALARSAALTSVLLTASLAGAQAATPAPAPAASTPPAATASAATAAKPATPQPTTLKPPAAKPAAVAAPAPKPAAPAAAPAAPLGAKPTTAAALPHVPAAAYGPKPMRAASASNTTVASAAAVPLPVAIPVQVPARASLASAPEVQSVDSPILSPDELSSVAPRLLSTAPQRVSPSMSFDPGNLPAPTVSTPPGDNTRVRPLTGTALGRLFSEDARGALLSGDDMTRYRRALDATRRGDKAAADQALAGVTDRRLVGFVQSQTKGSGRKYSAASRGDGPNGRTFHEDVGDGTDDFLRGGLGSGNPVLSAVDRAIARDDTAGAVTALGQGTGLSAAQAARARTFIAARMYYFKGAYGAALEQAQAAANTDGTHSPTAQWLAGLAAWRLERTELAARLFAKLSANPRASDGDRAAGAFWAGRAELKLGHADAAEKLLTLAAREPRSFYGMLATRALGLDLPLDWSVPQMTSRHAATISAHPQLSRAVALLQLGEAPAAEDELEAFEPGSDRLAAEATQTLVDAGGMARIAYSISGGLPAAGKQRLALGWPVPWWQPADGWKVDPAIVLALARVESKYNPSARNGSGATGLMQLMPGTARLMESRLGASARAGGTSLVDPNYNLSLGQRYIQNLLDDPGVNGNLLYMVVAYNGGPGNLQKWRAMARAENDPLLFVESLASRETRAFVEQVLTNDWLYLDRLNQATPCLDVLAQGKWPRYSDGRMSVARN